MLAAVQSILIGMPPGAFRGDLLFLLYANVRVIITPSDPSYQNPAFNGEKVHGVR